jgi:cyclophilin family peptidyl-prolyl cis-trans isomerase/protein-disulfide isomerase
MFKKQILLLIIGVLLLSACSSNTAESTGTAIPDDPTESVEEPTLEETDPGNVFEGERMPCSTVPDIQVNQNTEQYQPIADQIEPVDLENDWIRGNPEAPITIFEYADFQCPACVGFAQYTEFLLEYFPDTVKVVFRHLPLPSIHDKAFISGMAGEAASAQDSFFEMHDFLYASQSEWSGLSEEEFIDWVIPQAGNLGLDVDQFEVDLLDAEKRAWLEEITEERLNMGMRYTPFVIVNGNVDQTYQVTVPNLIGYYQFDGYDQCPAWVIDPEKSYTAVLDTSAGVIEIELFPEAAPLAVNSFVFLSQEGWYDGVFFHRVIEGFVAQAGDPSGLGLIGPGYTFANETDNDLSFDDVGVLGMANSNADLNGSQFFITLAPVGNLDGGYTIFGQVAEGSLDVLSEIALRNPASMEEFDNFDNATVINGIEIIEN